jgi:hypothetical protein
LAETGHVLHLAVGKAWVGNWDLEWTGNEGFKDVHYIGLTLIGIELDRLIFASTLSRASCFTHSRLFL